MEKYYTIGFLVLLLTGCNFSSKNSADVRAENKITSISVKQAEGVGLTSFIFELSIQDQKLHQLLEEKEIDFTFYTPLERLNEANIPKVYKIDSCNYHILLASTLWADISKDAFLKEKEKLYHKTKITLTSSKYDLQWDIKGVNMSELLLESYKQYK